MNMKKALLGAMLPLALAACDRPVDTVDLVCLGNWGRSDMYTALGVMNVKIYEDHALVKVHGKEYKLNKWAERSDFEVMYDSSRFVTDEIIPGMSDKLGLDAEVNKRNGFMKYTVWIGNSGITCVEPHPYKGKYTRPTQTDECIADLDALVHRCRDSKAHEILQSMCVSYKVCYKFTDNDGCFVNEKEYTIPAEDAIKLSPAWDYNTEVKEYVIRGPYDAEPLEHTKDACDVLERVKKYIADKGFNEIKQEEMEMTRKEFYDSML